MAKKNRLPKRVAGVKVPKAFRRSRVGRFLASSTGQALVVDSLIAAGGALIGRQMSEGSPARELTDRTMDGARRAGKAATGATTALPRAISEGARSFMETLHREREAVDGGEQDDSKKKPLRDGSVRDTTMRDRMVSDPAMASIP